VANRDVHLVPAGFFGREMADVAHHANYLAAAILVYQLPHGVLCAYGTIPSPGVLQSELDSVVAWWSTACSLASLRRRLSAERMP